MRRSSASAAASRRRRCPRAGPSEIATLNRDVNAMTANLRQLEQDRALLLAGVSHDLRTPLARLRLGIEMQARDEATQAGMVADIEEMDRIIGQFLEFARTDRDAALEPCDAVAIVVAVRRALCTRGPRGPLRPRRGGAGAAAGDGVLAARRQSHRQRDRLRRAAGRGHDECRPR